MESTNKSQSNFPSNFVWFSGEHLVLVTADPEKGDKFAFDNHAFKGKLQCVHQQ